MGNDAISSGIFKDNETMPIIDKLLIAIYPSKLLKKPRKLSQNVDMKASFH